MGVLELLDAVGLEVVGDGLEIDPAVTERQQDGAVLVGVVGQRLVGRAMFDPGVQGLRRHGVDGVRADQVVDVPGIRQRRVLGAGARPQRALDPRPAPGLGGEVRLLAQPQERLVGGARVGDGSARAQLRGVFLQRVQLRVDHAVDTADEERGDRGDLARALVLAQAAGVGGVHLLVAVDREQQGDIDVDALGDQHLDRLQPRLGCGYLDHQVVAMHRAPQVPSLLDRAVGVMGQVRRDLEADEAVGALGCVVHWSQGVAGGLDILDREPLVERLGVDLVVGLEQVEDGLVVGAGAGDRLVEDGRVAGDAAQALVDQPGEPAAGDEVAVDVIEPQRLATGQQPFDRRHAGTPFLLVWGAAIVPDARRRTARCWRRRVARRRRDDSRRRPAVAREAFRPGCGSGCGRTGRC